MITIKNFVQNPNSVSLDEVREAIFKKLLELSTQKNRVEVIMKNIDERILMEIAISLLSLMDDSYLL